MRHLANDHVADRTDETEGLKMFHGDSWVLVIPDPEDPVTHVWAEGPDTDASNELAAKTVESIEQVLD
jgi:mannose-1-phosphate guanylyltransferase/phosphomannomutase